MSAKLPITWTSRIVLLTAEQYLERFDPDTLEIMRDNARDLDATLAACAANADKLAAEYGQIQFNVLDDKGNPTVVYPPIVWALVFS